MLTVLSFIVFVDLAHCYEAADVHQSEHNDQDEIHATLLSIILGSWVASDYFDWLRKVPYGSDHYPIEGVVEYCGYTTSDSESLVKLDFITIVCILLDKEQNCIEAGVRQLTGPLYDVSD